MARPPAGLCDSCRHQRVVRNTRGSTLLALRALEDRPGLPALSAPAGAWSAPATSRAARRRRASAHEPRRAGRRAWSCSAWPAAAAAIVLADSDGGRDGEPAASATGRWTALRPSLLARTEVAAARVGRFVYVVGGFERRSGRSTAAVERYDLRRDRWRRVRSMPVALNHPAAAAYRGDVYVLGGYTGRGDLRGEVASLYRYDPRARPVVAAARRADPPRRAGGGRRSGAKLYAAGGANSSDGALRTPRDLRLRRAAGGRAGPTWASRASTSPARSPAAPSTCSPAARPGGATSRSPSATCPRERRWERLPDMEKPRGGIGAAAVGGRVVVVGGEEQSGTIREVEAYDPARAPLDAGCRTCARRGTASAWSRTRAPRLRDRGRPRTGLLLLPGDRGARRQVARRSHIAFCSPMVSSRHFFARGCQT